jgi:hypothetical protein
MAANEALGKLVVLPHARRDDAAPGLLEGH